SLSVFLSPNLSVPLSLWLPVFPPISISSLGQHGASVPSQSGHLRPLDRAAAKAPGEFFLGHLDHLPQFWFEDAFTPLEARLPGLYRKPRTRADVLADVTAEDPFFQIRFDRLGQLSLPQLDGAVRDALRRVEPVRRDDRLSGAGVNAGPAFAAMIGFDKR